MDDLVTWLRARLDEANADLHTVECGWHQREFGHEGTDCTCGAPERLLTDLDAKRRLIDGATVLLHGPTFRVIGQDIIAVLALPFADRPGYREDWRP